jgi:chromosome segregation ATPase
MPRSGISYLEVAKVATKLMEQNIHPSIEAVRRELGTGSNSTINSHLRQWREKQGNQLEAQKGLPETLLVAVKGLYEAIQEKASQKVNIITLETQQAIQEKEQQLTQLQQEHAQLTQQKHALEEQLTFYQQQQATLQKEGAALTQDANKKATENELLQERLADKKGEIDRLIQQVKHAQHNLEHYRESILQQREEEKQAHDAHLTKLEQQLQQQQTISTNSLQTVAVQEKQIALLEHQVQGSEEKIQQSLQQCQNYELSLQKHEMDYHVLQEKFNKLSLDYQCAVDEMNHLKTYSREFEIKFEKACGQIEALDKALKKADDKITGISDKNLFLMQEKTELLSQLKQLT